MIFVIHSLFQFCMYKVMDAFVILVGLWFVYEKVWYLWYKKEFDYLAMIFRQETNIEGFYQNLQPPDSSNFCFFSCSIAHIFVCKRTSKFLLDCTIKRKPLCFLVQRCRYDCQSSWCSLLNYGSVQTVLSTLITGSLISFEIVANYKQYTGSEVKHIL